MAMVIIIGGDNITTPQRIFSCLKENGIHSQAISSSISGKNTTLLISPGVLDKTLTVLHKEFFNS
ncbi:MAG: hypothetical protein D6769_01645 [Methanobacteriota archaeon]|nr:MAG: hypothetical protein D6769_01645 [Euryarchaeota archaeon]